MKKLHPLKRAFLLIGIPALSLFGLTACDRESGVERAADEVGDALEEGADEVGETVEDIGD